VAAEEKHHYKYYQCDPVQPFDSCVISNGRHDLNLSEGLFIHLTEKACHGNLSLLLGNADEEGNLEI